MNIYQILAENSRQSPLYAFILSLFLYLIGAIVLLPLFIAILSLLTGIGLETIQVILGGEMEGTTKELAVFRSIQGANQILSWGFAAVVMAYLLGNPRDELRLRLPKVPVALFPILIIILSGPLVQGTAFDAESFRLPSFLTDLESWAHAREIQSQETLMMVLTAEGLGPLLFNICVFALLPAFCEEFFFRGYLQHLFQKAMNPHLAIWLSAFLFSFIHLQFYGFFPRLILGALLGYFVYASASLIPAIIAHFCFNFFSIVLVKVAQSQNLLSPEMLEGQVDIPIYLILFSLLSTILLLIYYFRLSQHSHE